MEDLRLHRVILHRALRKLGYVVMESTTPSEALQCHDLKKFNTVFLDWNFPDGTGEKLSTYLRDHMPHIRLVITSADTSPEMIERFRLNGAHHIISKRYTLSDLREVTSAPVATTGEPADKVHVRSSQKSHLNITQNTVIKQEMDAIRLALAENRSADAARAAHNLYGIASMFGLRSLAPKSREVELAILSGNITEKDVADLENELGKISSSDKLPTELT